eukprot:9489900-Pyramimonas_sp.AAC.1
MGVSGRGGSVGSRVGGFRARNCGVGGPKNGAAVDGGVGTWWERGGVTWWERGGATKLSPLSKPAA